jgi:hypothetical protein
MGPPGAILGGFSFSALAQLGAARLASRQGGLFKSEIGFRYRGTAAMNLRSASRD